MQRNLLSTIICAGLLAGCADIHVAEYQRPQTPAKAGWSRPAADGVSATETITPLWWQQFGDPNLNALVAKAIAGNVDLKVLAARIEVANAQIAEARAGAMPTVDVAAGSDLQKTTGQILSKQFDAGTRVSWDLDVWGKVAMGVKAQTAEFHATEADWRAGYLQIVGDVATTYFQILQFDEQIDRQQHGLERSEQILDIDTAMASNGLIKDSEVLRQRAENNRLTKDLIELRRSRRVAENALATLVGEPAGAFKVEPRRLQDQVKVPAVPLGLPLDLLARRPDVLAAEFRVLQAHDLMGQARLAQLPSIGLNGLGGTGALSITDLFRSLTLALIPTINLPAFNPGNTAHVATTEAAIRVSEEEYRRTVIAAYEEVENALVNLDAHRRQKEELQQQVDRLKVVSASNLAQLEVGIVSRLDVFVDEQSLLAAQLALLTSHEQVLADTVTLYKALGGGWAQAPVELANARH